MLEQLFILLSVSIVIQIILFIPAFIYKTDKLTDLSYSFSFFILSLFAFWQSPQNTGHILLFAMISLWAFRLGGYLFVRIRKIKRDKRFDGIRENFFRFLKFWLGQGVVVWLVMISSILYFGELVQLNYFAYTAIVAWGIALIIEIVSDWQKYVFINNKENKGKWIESGLWKYSRHPNYFGEILHWVAIYLFVFGSLETLGKLIGLISPVAIFVIIVFATGLPILEREADKRWGSDQNYIKYKKRTSVLIPWFNKKI
ncbi:hypothetical protein C0580_04845 [Candidatus Parcubacteria bacterium]|nr:MAG: hypothetical protein C0580_04845 [Candidatus Parcubacteria bacterium]